MAQVAPELVQELETRGDSPVALIARVAGDPAQYTEQVRALGLTVHRTFRLTSRLAIRGPARACLALVHQEWILALEEDAPVQAVEQSPA